LSQGLDTINSVDEQTPQTFRDNLELFKAISRVNQGDSQRQEEPQFKREITMQQPPECFLPLLPPESNRISIRCSMISLDLGLEAEPSQNS